MTEPNAYTIPPGGPFDDFEAERIGQRPTDPSTITLLGLYSKVAALYEAVNQLTEIAIKINARLNIHNEIGQTMTDWVAELEDKVDAHLVEAAAFKAEQQKVWINP